MIAPTEPFGTRYWSPYAQLRKTSDAFVALTRSTDSVNNLRYDFVQLRNFQHLQKLSNVKFQQGNWSSRTAHNHTISVESRLPSDYTCPFYAPQIAEPTSGSRTLQTWKSGPGRKKDWRRCVYTGIPINAPNLGRMFHFKYQPHSRKSSVRGSCRWTTELADIEVDVNFEISMYVNLLPRAVLWLNARVQVIIFRDVGGTPGEKIAFAKLHLWAVRLFTWQYTWFLPANLSDLVQLKSIFNF